MHKTLPLFLWLLAALSLSFEVRSQAFSCDGTFYQIRQVGATSSLFRVDRSATAYTTVPVNVRTVGGVPTNDLGVLLNGLAYNAQDGFMYALSTTGTSATLPTSIRMYRIDQTSITSLGAVTGLPNIQIATGTIDRQGRYYVSSQNSNGTPNYNLYRFNLGSATPLAATALRFRNADNTADADVTFYDLALNPRDNQLYGVFTTGTLWRIDPLASAATNQARVTGISTAPAAGSEPIGSAIFDVAGNLSVYSNGAVGTANSGKFYQVDLVNGAYSLISNLDPASVSDGASCVNPSIFVDVVKQVTGVSRPATPAGIAGREYQITFQFKIKNTGTRTLERVQVSDFLWSGAAATTQLGSAFSAVAASRASNVVVSNLTVTNNGTATLVANNAGATAFNGISTAATPIRAGLLTGDQSLTAGQSATIAFTATVTYPTVSGVPAVAYNQAYASVLGGATSANGGFRLGATTGSLLSPTNGNLQAVDNSTNSATLPATANGDVESPSPIVYPTTIAGSVFEDVNYGGGAGRSQTASGGANVMGARVELYRVATAGGTDAYTYLNATTTGPEGYAFTTDGTAPLAANTTYAVRVVNGSVRSTRGGSVAALLPVQTFRTDATTATTTDVTNYVGGQQPNEADYGDVTTGSLPASGASATQEVQSLTKLLTPSSGPRASLDFGFNFDVVVNTNNAGQGSLRQFIENSNALLNGGTLAQAGRPANFEYAIFMLNDGRTTGPAPAGLRLGMAAAPGYNAATKQFVVALTAALPTVSGGNTGIDGSLQAAVTGNNVAALAEVTTGPEVAIDFNTQAGLLVSGSNARIASIGLHNAKGASALPQQGAGLTFTGAGATGGSVTDVTATGNTRAGVRLQNDVPNITVTNNVLNSNLTDVADADGLELLGATNATITGNTLSNNKGYGLLMATAANTGNTISNNVIRSNGSGLLTADAGISITTGTNNVFANNTIVGNAGDGIVALSGTFGNRFTQNSLSQNGDLGIDLSATAAPNGDGATKNANGKTSASGANGLLNFSLITQAVITNTTTGSLRIKGFAPMGSLIELYLADRTTVAFGQGKTYLLSMREGGTLNGIADEEAPTGSYSGIINGLDQGAETGASRYQFTIPLSSLSSAQVAALTSGTARVTATATSGASTSEFSGNVPIGLNQPLPVELTTFDAKADGTDARLTWSTASERDNAYFTIERSLTGTTFEAIGRVQGAGTSIDRRNYSFLDAGIGALHPGLVYYRLQQVDTDGQTTASPVRSLRFAAELAPASLELYPNPTNHTATLNLTALPAGNYQVTVVDAAGRLVSSGHYAGGTRPQLNLQQVAQGVYFVTLRGQGVKITKTLTKE